MKKRIVLVAMSMVMAGFVFGGCGKSVDPGAPPEEVIHAVTEDAEETEESKDQAVAEEPQTDAETGKRVSNAEGMLEDAVSVKVGRVGTKEYMVNMYNNADSNTILDHLFNGEFLLISHTYSEEEGFLAEVIEGEYTREDETTIEDVKAGDIYLLSGNQLRFYFQNVTGANISATPVGQFLDAEASDMIPETYETDKNDAKGTAVWFKIRKLIDYK